MQHKHTNVELNFGDEGNSAMPLTTRIMCDPSEPRTNANVSKNVSTQGPNAACLSSDVNFDDRDLELVNEAKDAVEKTLESAHGEAHDQTSSVHNKDAVTQVTNNSVVGEAVADTLLVSDETRLLDETFPRIAMQQCQSSVLAESEARVEKCCSSANDDRATKDTHELLISSTHAQDEKIANPTEDSDIRNGSEAKDANQVGSSTTDRSENNASHVRTIFRQQPHGIDEIPKFSSVSSVSSTISPGSTVKGIDNNAVTFPPSFRDASSHRHQKRPSIGSERTGSLDMQKPPLFPRKGDSDASTLGENNPSRMMELLSQKLVAHTEPDAAGESTVDTGFMKKKALDEYDPKDSVFAFMDDDDDDDEDNFGTPSLSPPGSPPEPDFTEYDEDALSLDSQANSLTEKPEVSVWDMISARKVEGRVPEMKEKPEFVVLTTSDTFTSEAGQSSLTQIRSIVSDGSMVSTGKKHRGRHRRLSGSGHLPLSNRMTSAKRNRVTRLDKKWQDFRISQSLHESTSFSNLKVAGEGLAMSSITTTHNKSSPDLRILNKTPASMLQHIETPDSSKNRPRAFSADGAMPSESLKPTVARRQNLADDSLVSSPSHTISRQLHGSPASQSLNTFTTGYATPIRADDRSLQHRKEIELEDALRRLCHVDRLDIPFRSKRIPRALSYTAEVRWRQLLANWKHSQAITLMLSRYPSKHFAADGVQPLGDKEPSLDSTAALMGWANLGPQLENDLSQGVQSTDSALDPWKNRDGFVPFQCERGIQVHSRVLSTMGGPWNKPSDERKILCQTVEGVEGLRVVERLLSLARSYEDDLENILKDMVACAAENVSSVARQDHAFSLPLSFSVDVKGNSTIEKKAKRKYEGNVLLVKDALRGQVVFPDEGSLVCGILRLSKVCKTADTEDSPENQVAVKIVRIKNLFYTSSSLGILSPSPLPTGYRHVLLNIEMKRKGCQRVIAEIQCHLAPLYHVSGDAGAALHRDICELECLLQKHQRAEKPSSRDAGTVINTFDLSRLVSLVCDQADFDAIEIDMDAASEIVSVDDTAETKDNVGDEKNDTFTEPIASPIQSMQEGAEVGDEPSSPPTPAAKESLHGPQAAVELKGSAANGPMDVTPAN